jgi:hypothetical protein
MIGRSGRPALHKDTPAGVAARAGNRVLPSNPSFIPGAAIPSMSMKTLWNNHLSFGYMPTKEACMKNVNMLEFFTQLSGVSTVNVALEHRHNPVTDGNTKVGASLAPVSSARSAFSRPSKRGRGNGATTPATGAGAAAGSSDTDGASTVDADTIRRCAFAIQKIVDEHTAMLEEFIYSEGLDALGSSNPTMQTSIRTRLASLRDAVTRQCTEAASAAGRMTGEGPRVGPHLDGGPPFRDSAPFYGADGRRGDVADEGDGVIGGRLGTGMPHLAATASDGVGVFQLNDRILKELRRVADLVESGNLAKECRKRGVASALEFGDVLENKTSMIAALNLVGQFLYTDGVAKGEITAFAHNRSPIQLGLLEKEAMNKLAIACGL